MGGSGGVLIWGGGTKIWEEVEGNGKGGGGGDGREEGPERPRSPAAPSDAAEGRAEMASLRRAAKGGGAYAIETRNWRAASGAAMLG